MTHLEPLSELDVPALWRLAELDDCSPFDSLASLAAFAGRAAALGRSRREFHFTVHTRGSVAGIVSLFDIDWTGRSATSGTWLAAPYRGRGINAQAKSRLIDHAFAELGLERLRFETLSGNVRARQALEKLGAVPDGFVPNGLPSRDLMLFSIWRDEDQ